MRVACDAVALHAPGVVGRLGPADHHLFRIAAPQRAGAAEGPEVHDGHGPPGRPHPHRHDHGGRTGSNDGEIVFLGHVVS
jgi:hypothetical protein